MEKTRVVGSGSLADGPKVSSSSLEQVPRVPSEELVLSFEMEIGDDGDLRLCRERGRGGGVLESSEDVGLGSGVVRVKKRMRRGTERERRLEVAEERPGVQPGGCSEWPGLEGGRAGVWPARRN